MAHVRQLVSAATHVLSARTHMWHVLGEWGELMDTLYATPCFDEGRGVGTRSLVERLEMDLEELAEEVEGITVRLWLCVYVCVSVRVCVHVCMRVCVRVHACVCVCARAPSAIACAHANCHACYVTHALHTFACPRVPNPAPESPR